uniref:DUF4913 domain-containing protein n=1 Tax=Arthrobacter sp. TaxID=1667 RepID=UPI00159EE4C0|nr:DUF4913 domain-containing protein [Arthrobacter sp.]
MDKDTSVQVSDTPTPAQARLETAYKSLAEAEDEIARAQKKVEENLSAWLHAAAVDSLAQAERAKEQAEKEVEQAAADLVEPWDETSAELAPVSNPAEANGEEPRAVYETAEQFLLQFLLPLYIRIIDTRNGRWCRKWYLHAEAVSRVDALWRVWEHLRLDGKTGMSVWWKDHADHHMAVLLNQKGPFHLCSLEQHTTPEPIPCDPAPPNWFPREGDIPFP